MTTNKITNTVEARIVELSLQHPNCSARRLMPLLEQEGIQVTASAVHAILKRNDLHTKTKRLSKLEAQHSEETSLETADSTPPTAEQQDHVPAHSPETTPKPRISPPIKALKKTNPRRPWSLSVTNLLLLGVIGYFWFSAVGNFLNASRQPLPVAPPPPADVSSKPKTAVRPLEDYSIITERNLFGISEEEASAPQEEVSLEGLPVSLKVAGLKLVGTVASNDSTKSFAILDNLSTRKQELYREGDKVGEALLKKILRNKVVLNTENGDEVLTMEFDESGQGQKTSQVQTSHPLAREPITTPTESQDQNSAFFDVGEFMQQVKISPYVQGDQAAGFSISGSGGVLTRFRLRNGDVITGVNGEAITSPDQAREIFEKFAQGEEVILDILRRNRPRNIRLR